MSPGALRRVPRATYRAQLHAGFDFDQAADLLDYLDALGVSHLYTSPLLGARRGSSHGYDITDHDTVSLDLGGDAGLERLATALRVHGMGLLVDFVPNHMGIGYADNAWWLDVLEWGARSPYAAYFDIDWEPVQHQLRGKVLVPFLGDHYGRILENGDLEVRFEDALGFSVYYYEHRFPISPPTYPLIFGQRVEASAQLDELLARFRELGTAYEGLHGESLRERAAELKRELARLVDAEAGVRALVDDAVSALCDHNHRNPTALHELLEAQPYRLAYWRVAADEINYRRFFDINELAGLRVELDQLFDLIHDKLLELVEAEIVRGLRIDHVDGLYDPARYCERLRATAQARGANPYLVVEKILADHESLREWTIDGTTGYDFMADVGALLVDPSGKPGVERIYRRQLGGHSPRFDDVVYRAKHDIMQTALAGELQVLANHLERIAERSWRTRDFTLQSLRDALREVVAAFPVYRTYVTEAGASEEDRRDIDWAVAAARRRRRDTDASVFDFIHAVLTLDLECSMTTGYENAEVVRFAMRFQQYTGPVMAKSMEDTSLYRYVELLSLNEVGSHPNHFGLSLTAFHRRQQLRGRYWPHSLLATSTHDHKRGEDTRARIAVLSEMPEELSRHLTRWKRLIRWRRKLDDGSFAPSDNDVYLLYQTLIGSWPAELTGVTAPTSNELAPYVERLTDYMVKAIREAKRVSSWARPDLAYEEATAELVRRMLDVRHQNRFLADFVPFQARVAERGVFNSLTQTVLKLCGVGVPDIYQGSELWDLSLVDPDNRRPVDYDRRRTLLAELDARAPRFDTTMAEELLSCWTDGRIKLWVVFALLKLRRAHPDLFEHGAYHPVTVEGPHADRVVAFVRQYDGDACLVVAARHTQRVTADRLPIGDVWAGTHLTGPLPSGRLRRTLVPAARPLRANSRLAVADVLRDLPVAVLVTESSSHRGHTITTEGRRR